MSLPRGTIVLVVLDPARGHEQAGTRPCVLVSSPTALAQQRFPLYAVVPLTGTMLGGTLYPVVAPGASGLRKPSTALVDHVRAVDGQRIVKAYGAAERSEIEAIDAALRLFMAL